MQAAFVVQKFDGDYDQPCGPAGGCLDPTPLPKKLAAWSDHFGLDRVAVLQFAPTWAIGDIYGVGDYAFDPVWQSNIDAMVAEDLFFGLYLLDNHYDKALPAFTLGDWSQQQIRWLTGKLAVVPLYDLVPGGGLEHVATHAKIDARTQPWLDRIEDIAFDLATRGVRFLYIDNFGASHDDVCFSLDPAHGHPPGFDRSLEGGYAETFEVVGTVGAAATAGTGAPDAGVFGSISELSFEANIAAHGHVVTPTQPAEDWMTGGPMGRVVPLHAIAWHKWAPFGPVHASYYYRLLAAPSGSCSATDVACSVFSADPVQREAGRRGGCYTLAFGALANGSPVWPAEVCPELDVGFPMSYTLPDTPPGGEPNSLVPYKRLAAFAARLGALRGEPATRAYLSSGQRLRDLRPAATSVIPQIQIGLAPFEPTNCPPQDTELVPILVQGIWGDPLLPGRIGLFFGNHSGGGYLGGSFALPPQEYGLNPGTNYVVRRWNTANWTFQIVGGFNGGVNVAWIQVPPIAAESVASSRSCRSRRRTDALRPPGARGRAARYASARGAPSTYP